MRVAFFSDSYLPTHDGVAQVTAGLARALAARGILLTIHTVRTPGSLARERLADGVEVIRYGSVAAPSYPQYRMALLPWWPTLGRRSGSPVDIVHVHTPGFVGLAGWWASRRSGVPSVGTFHTNLPEMLRASPHGPLARWFFRHWGDFSRHLCWWCNAATAPSPEAARALEAGHPSPGAFRVRVIGNGVDTARFHPGIQEPDWTARLAAPDLPLVTFLGRLTRDKGILRFLDALAAMPPAIPFRGVVAGEGPLAAEVANRIAGSPVLASRVRYVGAIPESEKPALLAQSRLFVLPSTGDTSSVALLEAMACGAAAVVTSRGGPASLVRSGTTGVLVDPESPVEIRAAIAGLLEDPAQARALGSSAADWVQQNASIDQAATAYLRLYEELLERS